MILNSKITQNNRNQQSFNSSINSVTTITENIVLSQAFSQKSLNLSHLQVQTPLEELRELCKKYPEFRKLSRPLLSLVLMAQDKPQQIKALRYMVLDMKKSVVDGQEYSASQEEIAQGAGVSERTVWAMQMTLYRSFALIVRNRYRISKDNKRLKTKNCYRLNTGFSEIRVRQFLESILPGINELYSKDIMLNCGTYYEYKNYYLPYITDVGFCRPLTFGEFCTVLPGLLLSGKRDNRRFFYKMEADWALESRWAVPEKGTTDQSAQKKVSFKAEKQEGNSMNISISPVIDGITMEQIPLTLAGRIFLSQYPDSALEHALGLLPEGEENPLKFVKDTAWQYLLDNNGRRLKDRQDQLRKQHNITEKDALVEKKQKQKSVSIPGVVMRGERYKTADYADLYNEFAQRQLDGREPLGFNPFEGRMKGQGTMTRAEYDAKQEEERAKIIADRNEMGRLARQEKIARMVKSVAANIEPVEESSKLETGTPNRTILELERLAMEANTVPEYQEITKQIAQLKKESKSVSDNANKAYFKALAMSAQPIVDSLETVEALPFDDDGQWEEVFDI